MDMHYGVKKQNLKSYVQLAPNTCLVHIILVSENFYIHTILKLILFVAASRWFDGRWRRGSSYWWHHRENGREAWGSSEPTKTLVSDHLPGMKNFVNSGEVIKYLCHWM